VNLLTNPIFLRMALVLVLAAAAFGLGFWLMRRVRQHVQSGLEMRQSADQPGFALQAYHGVIQRLKEQEEELKRLRQAASDRAAASENISAAVISNLASGVLLFNNAGLVQQANPAARALLGYASPLGLHARDVLRGVTSVREENGDAGSTDSPVQCVEEALRKPGTVRRFETEYSTPAGERRLLEITISPVRTAGGESLGAACLVSDVTEVTELARQVRLRESLAALGEMSAGIAHEFKNSLATISGYAQMLSAESDPVVRQNAAKIAGETANLSRIVSNFLNFARPQELEYQPVDLRALLRDCAAECGVRLEAEIPPEISMEGDPVALRQAFSNLLRNSAEAAREGVSPEVKVTASGEGASVRLEFRDNGRGIPQQQLGRVFIPFFTTKAEGTGLGLALVHRIITQHGGAVAVASDGCGATFTLTVPARKYTSAAAKPR
jgi:PAS domain S-box-containing protein